MIGRATVRLAGVAGLMGLVLSCDSVNVISPDPAVVVITPSEITLEIGETVTLTVTVRNADGDVLSDQPIQWSLDRPGVATVSSTGKVQAVGLGSAIVTARAGLASGTADVAVQTTGP